MNKKLHKDEVRIDEIHIPVYSTNTLVIGSGVAALNAAVNLVNLGQDDVIIATDNWGGGTSNNAGSDKQTYYKLSSGGKVPDSAYEMAHDLFKGGCMHGDIALCEAQHSLQSFFHLVQLGVPFPHDRFGAYIGYKTDHDQKGRGISAGPLTSKMMFEALEKDVNQKGIPVLDRHEIIALLTKDEKGKKCVTGAIALDKKNPDAPNMGFVLFNSVNIILGTGGPAGIYQTSVYPESQSGSSGLALKIGAKAQNLTESQFGLASIKFRWNLSGSYQQAIPRYISTDMEGGNEKDFLGEFFPDPGTMANAIFLKGYQWPFDPGKIRDYGSSLIDILVYRETVQKKRRVFLDYTRNPEGLEGKNKHLLDKVGREALNYLKQSNALLDTPLERLQAMNRPAIDLYANHGIDLAKSPLEIAVCAQHNNGGLAGNCWWESNIKHLFPVGEVNGSHGVYRPGGSALNSGQVGSLRSALYISKQVDSAPHSISGFLEVSENQIRKYMKLCHNMIDTGHSKVTEPASVIEELRGRMSGIGGIVRNKKEINQAILEAHSLYQKSAPALKVPSPDQLPVVFKALDHCLVHWIYLEAIGEYLKKAGKSRGSYLVIDKKGEPACEKLEKEWNFMLTGEEDFVNHHILEISHEENGSLKKEWVKVRPIPDQDHWFETIWKDFRENKIIK